MTKSLTLAAITAMIACGSAIAQEPNPPAEQPPASQAPTAETTQPGAVPEFAALDANNDGTISKEEAAAHAGLSGAFADSDADKDGRLTASEYADARSRLGR
jgi:hypothetical protein